MSLGQRLKDARVQNGWTVKQAADLVGIDRSSIASYERGKNEPRTDTLNKICKVYRCKIKDITDEPPEESEEYYYEEIGGDTLGEKIRLIRESFGWSQVTAGMELSVDASSLSRYESNETIMSPEMLQHISDVYEWDFEELNALYEQLPERIPGRPLKRRPERSLEEPKEEIEERPARKQPYSLKTEAESTPFGNILFKLRVINGFHQQDVADKIGIVGGVSVSNWERGKYVPALNYAEKLFVLYNNNVELIQTYFLALWDSTTEDFNIEDFKQANAFLRFMGQEARKRELGE